MFLCVFVKKDPNTKTSLTSIDQWLRRRIRIVYMEKLEEAQDKGKESHTMWYQAILGKNPRQQQQGILGKCGRYNAPRRNE